MRKIVYAPEALEDLKRIKESIILNFGDEELAKRCVRDLISQINNLGIFPYMGRDLERDTGIPTDNEKQDYLRTLFGISETDGNE